MLTVLTQQVRAGIFGSLFAYVVSARRTRLAVSLRRSGSLFDGTTWRAARHPESDTPAYTPTGPRLEYRLTLEPHNQRWLLALDFPADAPAGTRYSAAFQAMGREPVRTRTRLDLSAYPDTPVGMQERSNVLEQALRLPAAINPRTRALATELIAGNPPAADILTRALTRLSELGLVYTLRPPLTASNGIDSFLFDTRRGFCEHFSSAFVFLMRAAGVPARVVTGYQGGEINPVDKSLIVRQSDAHAWAEVWLPDRGWVRVDPTALAAPGRIESGLAGGLPAGEALPLLMRPQFSWLRDLRFRWEAASNLWNQWVLGYNPERQRELLSRMGFGEPAWRTWIVVLAAAAAGLMGLLFLWAIRQGRAGDPVDRLWARFCTRLARHGLARHPAEGPLDFGRRIASAMPEKAAELNDITHRYARLRYRPPASPDAVRELKRRIRNLKLT
ncbi:DUF3488 domain-containing protein [Azoarcus sp. L1K30]|uniref:transglutaminase TgpA family protein n=1 Tax=Azoarcus sp. L1K30 TaxID=2820277 RepID=UPI001B8376FD|nr:DUF3488 domain-containing protein [Azoarcus sp. L1K30]